MPCFSESTKKENYMNTRYIPLFGIRLIFRDGKFHGWYRP